VDVLGLVREILPMITTLVTRSQGDNVYQTMRDNVAADKADTPRRYYAVVESDHPYKPAAVHNYRVIVPQNSVTYLLTYLLT